MRKKRRWERQEASKGHSREVKGEDEKAKRTAVNEITFRRKMRGDEERGKREEVWQGRKKKKSKRKAKESKGGDQKKK